MRTLKAYLKSKRFRKLKKEFWLLEKKRMKKDGVYHVRSTEGKLCSECDPLSCICERNRRASELIDVFNFVNQKLFPVK